MNRTDKRFYLALVIFGLMGQVAWVIENMYFNVFIYKIFSASASDISAMVAASAVTAAVTTIIMGALSDRIGKRRLLIAGGYIIWGISILAFAFIRMDILTPIAGSTAAAASLGVSLVIVMDCIMTFFGSTANDAAFNAWLTDWGDEGNRGKIEGINSMMPMIAILVVFGGFMAFDLSEISSWTTIYIIIGVAVTIIGVSGLFLIRDRDGMKKASDGSYLSTVTYSFRPSVIRENPLLYAVLGCNAVFGISIQVFMPYLILYYEQSLGMTNYVLIFAPAIIIAAAFTAFYGKLYDMVGFKTAVIPPMVMLMAGYVVLFFCRSTVPVFFGSLLLFIGNLSGGAMLGAMIRSNTPEQKAGQFQGVRIIASVLIPGVIGPAIGAQVLRNAELVVNGDGTTSFLPNANIFAAALVVAVLLIVCLCLVFRMMRNGHYDLMSEAGEKIGDSAWTEYPRPQMKRDNWTNLNGTWLLDGKNIRVPFSPQAKLSGFTGKVGNTLCYRRSITVEETENRILLHFGAVDQTCHVMINGTTVGTHEGGYLPFSFDITRFVTPGENLLEVIAEDSLNHDYPYGKQTKKRGGMWYTPVSGIWQTVWMEEVPKDHIKSLEITPDLSGIHFHAETELPVTLEIRLPSGATYTVEANHKYIPIPEIRLWSPEDPYLYTMTVRAGEDTVETYFGLRTVKIEEIDGVQRVLLNEKPLFINGVLDQGYFCDGLFLPAEAEEYRRDILRMKELGINLLRKHIKAEPEWFYYLCDKEGMLVMQDMVNNASYSFLMDTALPTIGVDQLSDKRKNPGKRSREIFKNHMLGQLSHHHNHPSVIAYTIFNEGWGQFEADQMYALAKETDPSRIYDATSGWFWQKDSDFDSYHIYFGDKEMKVDCRPMFLSEFGGYSYEVPGHIYAKFASYGYGACKSREELSQRIAERYRAMVIPKIKDGLCGCIYTQVSDVEDEINGFYTYDRKVLKVLPETMQALAREIKEEMSKL